MNCRINLKNNGVRSSSEKENKVTEKQEVFKVQNSGAKMENNQAIEEAKKWANDRNITIYKTGIKQINGESTMEVHFITPQIALRHEMDLAELSYRIGMPVTYAKQPKQNEIIQRTVATIPETWALRKIHLFILIKV
ncbi:hypothetical protein ACI2OX_19085 [Bacillus sp. N9]